jgi:SNF2 family DNA or RNA helicase
VTCLKTSTETDAATKLWSWLALLQLCCNHPYPFREKLAGRSNQSTDDSSNSPEAESSVSVLPGSMKDFLPGSIKDAGLPSDLFPKIEALFEQVDQPLDPALSHRSTLLNQILDESIMVGDKVLVFSQSIPTMDYLDILLQKSGRSYLRIDGRTPGADRQALCKRFNTSDSEHVFLISTRAGALGLNIFGANRVVIFDFLGGTGNRACLSSRPKEAGLCLSLRCRWNL